MQLVQRTFCKTIKELRPCANFLPKVARTNVLEWRTPEERDKKTGSSCIKIPQLGRGDNDAQSPQLKGPLIQNVGDRAWRKLGRNRAQKGPGRPAHPVLVSVCDPLYSVLSKCNPNRVGKQPFTRDAI
jgi:hypothetical protein